MHNHQLCEACGERPAVGRFVRVCGECLDMRISLEVASERAGNSPENCLADILKAFCGKFRS